ncbi:MAG: hypothetical protein K0R26_1011 [Bacteroidota bacterium]|jgi:hypothetical protein|nr:hypothetical protein [Bacteroidota bacterium]
MKSVFCRIFLVVQLTVNAQFAPPTGQPGSTAMSLDSSAFKSWATGCIVNRGFQDVSNPSLGYTDVGDASLAIGIADYGGVVCLGDGGSAILTFATPVINGAGPDFAVFENGFDDAFLELAFVEVSSDGGTFFRFPATSNSDTVTQTWSFGLTDATKINNLAGKYRGGFGTPFDLDDIPDNLLLNKQAITHVKIVDVVGSLQDQYCSRDRHKNKINDPWPTGFGNGGFDLDAVGVINQMPVGVDELGNESVSIYPNPAEDKLILRRKAGSVFNYEVCSILGKVLLSETSSDQTVIDVSCFQPGVYSVIIKDGVSFQQLKFLKL